jgi:Flp pilus assembly protein TadG
MRKLANRGTIPARARRPRRRGAAAVEFAVVAPIFFVLCLGIIEFGRGLMVTELLNEAARKGCRKGIIEGTSTQQIKDAATNFLSTVGINGETAQVIINDGVGNVSEAQTMPAYTEITVIVQVPVSNVTWMPTAGMTIYVPGAGQVPVGPSGNLTGQFTMRRE